MESPRAEVEQKRKTDETNEMDEIDEKTPPLPALEFWSLFS
jgi:hypothetical protein